MNGDFFRREYLTIKRFAQLVGVTVDTLRYYDRQGIFMPVAHGIDHENKYRYYTAPQFITFKLIRILREIGVSIDTIRDLANNRTPEKVLKVLSRNKIKVADEIRFLQDVLSVICTFIDLIQEGLCTTETEIIVTEKPGRAIILGEENTFSEPGFFMGEFIRFYKSTHKPSINMSFPVGGYWPDIQSFLKDPVRPVRFFSLDPKGNEERGAGLYMIGYSRGYYGHISNLLERMKAFAKKNGLLFTGEVFATYLFDEISILDPNQYLMEVAVGVTETRRVPSRRPRRRNL